MEIAVLTLLLSLLTMSSGAGPIANDKTVITVCRTLEQDDNDIGMCCDKASGNHIESGEAPILTYLCCLGYFGDTKKSYMDKITFGFLRHIVSTKDENEHILEAEFIAVCQDPNKANLRLEDYEAWKKTDMKRPNCRIKP